MKQTYIFLAISKGGVVVSKKIVKAVPDELFEMEYDRFKSEYPALLSFWMSGQELEDILRNLHY
jgi:hypothetical protein